MQLKSQTILSTLIAIILSAQNVCAQKAMLKGGGILLLDLESSAGIIDVGFEYKINKKFSVQLSGSASGKNGNDEGSNNKTVVSLQSRYYLNGEKWGRSPFAGVVVQKLRTTDWRLEGGFHSPDSYIGLEKKANKAALGFILGHNVQIFRRIGLDFHVGAVGQLGRETRVSKASKTAPALTTVRKNALDARPFWGVNLYIALGKMPPKEPKPAQYHFFKRHQKK